MLKITDASLSYKKQALFSGLNLEIPEDEWVVILGKSGVGKTSLLRMIAGLTKIFPEVDTEVSGRILWQGKNDLQVDVAYMAQQDGLFPWLSVFDNVIIYPCLQGKKINRQQAQKFLEQVGLGGHFDKKPAVLSGGMRQRVALARTLMQDKPILLMDEPFSALDALTRLEMQTLFVNTLRPRKKMLIMVTHDPWEALRIADRIIVLAGVPAEITYTMLLPKSTEIRPIDPGLLKIYNEILAALE